MLSVNLFFLPQLLAEDDSPSSTRCVFHR